MAGSAAGPSSTSHTVLRHVPSCVAAAVLVATVLGSGLFSSGVRAHDGLILGAPTPGQDVGGEIKVIQLYFGEAVAEATVSMEDPEGNVIEGTLGQPTVDLLEYEIDGLVEDGPYIVRYSILFEDEAVYEAAYQFTYRSEFPPPVLIEVENRLSTGRSWLETGALAVLAGCVLSLLALFLWRYQQLRALRA